MPDSHDPLTALLDTLCPFHLRISNDMTVIHAGPTCLKLLPNLSGQGFFDVFKVRKPNLVSTESFTSLYGQALGLETIEGVKLTGVAMPWNGETVVNLSFGFHSVQAVQRYGLNTDDFAPTDQTLGMLFLHEAKTMALSEFKRLSSRLNGAKLRAETQANTDALTGLFNLRALRDELCQSNVFADPFALLTIDLDHFKAVNDTLGHAAGDHVLREAAKIFQQETRANDIVARNGGDEFTVLLKGVSDRQTALDIGARIITQLERPIPFENATCHISASIGTIFSADFPDSDMDAIFANADKALYGSKRAGRGRNTVFAAP